MDVLGIDVDLGRQWRPRTHQGHRAGEHVEQLRELVEGVLAQPGADLGHPRVLAELEQRPVGLVAVGEARELVVRTDGHAAELPDPEPGRGPADALLAIERRTAVLLAHEQRHHEQRQPQENQQDEGAA